MRRVLLLTDTIYDFYNEGKKVGGIAVQMSFWAKVFLSHGWSVYSLSQEIETTQNGVTFVKYPRKGGLYGILLEVWLALVIVLRVRPDVIICRGARRKMTFFLFWSRLIRSKFVFFGASDNDFKPEEELIVDKKSRLIYRIGLRCVKYFVLQNQNQVTLLQANYGKNHTLVIPNIWIEGGFDAPEVIKDIDLLWVGNFRELKRPTWFVELAKKYPEFRFVMVGGIYDEELYHKCEEEASKCENLSFLGQTSFDNVNLLFRRSRLYICTSTIEGFPNTFLQAWANNIPVITTFDPGGVVRERKLGFVVIKYEDLCEKVEQFLYDLDTYHECTHLIKLYFNEEHSANNRFEDLMKFIGHENKTRI